jgi:hypothetical protein
VITELDEPTKTYLSAVGAMAVYVATLNERPVRVGFCRDLSRSLTFLGRTWPNVAFGWVAWFEDNGKASEFLVAVAERSREMLSMRRPDNVLVVRPLPLVVQEIELLASRHHCALTLHELALKRASACARRLDNVLVELQRNGTFHEFNRAYRDYRERQRMRGESAMPYWATKQTLRRLIVQWLASHDGINVDSIVAEIRTRFPWFNAR